MTSFTIADLHFFHKNIITFMDETGNKLRDFESILEHDETLIANWNKVVSPTDKVYVLGDVAINKKGLPLLSRLNGIKNSSLIAGNHDIFGTDEYLRYFKAVRGSRVFREPKFIMTHIPVHESELDRFKINVHGHLHNKIVPDDRYICVSAEHTNFTPLSFDELIPMVKERQ